MLSSARLASLNYFVEGRNFFLSCHDCYVCAYKSSRLILLSAHG